MVAINWKNPVDGDWSDAADWSTGTQPTPADDVTIAAAGQYTVAVTTADAANSLTLDDFTTTLQESAAGSLTLTGALTLDAGAAVLDGVNSIGGGVTIGSAGILEVGNAAALGTGPLAINGGLLLGTADETLTNALQLNGTFAIAAAQGTTLNLDSTTPWTLTNGSTVVFGPAGQNGTVIWHTPAGSQISDEGGVTIEVQGGTLKAGDAGFTFLFFNSPQTLVDAGATIDLAGFGAQFVNLQGGGTITDSGGAATLNLGNSNFAGTLSGALSLSLLGPVTLTGTNAYTGTTSLVINSLTLGDGGTTGSIAGQSAVTDDTSLIFDRSNDYTVANVISGTGSVQQIGTGTTTLTAANGYSGGTTITAGTLAVANSRALGTGPVNLTGGELLATTDVTITSLTLSGNVTLAAAKGATLDIDPPLDLSLTQAKGDTITFGAPGEDGTVIWTLPALGELALNGTIDLDTLVVQAGVLKGAVAPGNPAVDDLPTGVVLQTIVDAAGTIDIAGAQDQINDLQGAGTVTDSVGGGTLILNGGDFAGTLSGDLTLTTMGTVALTGTETYDGSTTIDAGSTLTLGNGGTGGSLASKRAVIDNGTLIFDRSDALTFANLVSGSGAIEQIGTGTTTLTAANTYAGGTTVAAGTLAVGNASALGTGPLTITGGELLGTTTETLTNALKLAGSETIAAAAGTTLTLDSRNQWALGGSTLTFGAPGQDGIVIWHTPSSETSGGLITTVDVAAGTLQAGDANFKALTFFSALQDIVEAGATVDLAGFSTNILDLQGSGTVTDTGGPALLQLSGNLITNSIYRADFAGTISGPLELSVLGPVRLTGTNTYTGSTIINDQSTLTLGNGGTSGSIAASGSMLDNGTLVLDRSDAVNFSNPISGAGAVVQAGTGTTTLANAANTYSGGTTISNGTLAIASGSALGSGTLTINGGELLGTGIETISNNLALSGSITIAAAHGGLLILSPRQADLTGLTDLVIGAAGQDGIVFWNSLVQTTTAGQSGTLDVRAGTLEIQGLFPFAQTIVEAGATLDIGGASLANDQIFLNDLQGTGTVTDSGQPAALILSGNTTFAGTLSGALSLEIDGNITLAGTTEVADGAILNPVRVETVSLTNTGTFILGSDAGVTGIGAPFQESFVNDGLFEKTGGTGASQVSVPFTNNGTIVVTRGSITFGGGFDNVGIIEGQLSGTTVSADPAGETFFYGGTGSNHFTVATAPTLISCTVGGTNTVEITSSLAFATNSLVNVQDVQVDDGVSADLSRLTTGENIVSDSVLGDGVTIKGTQGNDVFTTGLGADVLTGGAGADTFVLGAGALVTALTGAPDMITDYDQGGGHYNAAEGDQINLSSLLAPLLAKGDPLGSLVRVVAEPGGTFASLQIDPTGVPGHWIDLAHLDGIAVGETLAVIASQGSSTSFTVESVACYCRGTLIRTEIGDAPVESLAIGDRVMTASGALRPIKWIGRRSYGGRFVLGRKDILPVCFKAGSLSDNVPERDLWISPHHAMYFEHESGGVLIEAKDLVNGISIIQADQIDQVEYFHIELETHDVIVAEAALSETFVDDDSRGMFHNAQEYDELYGELYPEAVRPVARYCAPRLDEGYEVETIRRVLELRAGLRAQETPVSAGLLRGHVERIEPRFVEGWVQDTDHPDAPVCLDIYAGGSLIGQVLASSYREDLERAGIGSGRHSFSFTPPDGLMLLPGTVELRRSLDGAPLPVADRRRPMAA